MKTRLAFVFAFLSASAFAGTSTPEQIDIQPTESPSDWWVTITPYSWVTATDGDMGVAGRVAPVDISFKDTLEDLEFAFMLASECGINRWFLQGGGDIGGFGVSSDLIWQVNAALGYRFTDSVSALVGYRGLDEGPKRGWTIVSMKNDWKTIFPMVIK